MNPPRHDLHGTLGPPEIVEIEPTNTCNLRCRMCHVSYMPLEPRPFLNADLVEKLDSLAGKYIIIGSNFEPTIHPEFNRIVRRLTELDCRLDLITNGTRIDGEMLKVLGDSRLEMLQVSFDGIRKETYEHIRRRASFDDVIQRILKLRARLPRQRTYAVLNATMMRRNMGEIVEMIDFWDSADFDALRLIYMVIRASDPELIQESLYPVRGEFHRLLDDAARYVTGQRKRIILANPYFQSRPTQLPLPEGVGNGVVISKHPEARDLPTPREHYQLGAFPGMGFPCRSPFTFARIMPNGEVQLCYQFTVGNLNSASFEDIWFGAAADQVRKKVMAGRGICEKCDYFRFNLHSKDIEVNDIANYFSANVRALADRVDFTTGQVTGPLPAPPPRLIETIGAYNIVSYREKFFGLPQALGPMDLTTDTVEGRPGVLVGENLAAVRLQIRNAIR